MQELVVTNVGKLEWMDRPGLRIQSEKEAIVRPVASASCDLDRRLIAGKTPFKPTFAIGHECVAEVIDVGGAVRNFQRGDLVSVPWKISCGECRQCLAGRSSACTSVPKHAAYGVPAGGHWGGLYSEQVRVPFADAMLVALPAGVDPVAVAAVSDNLTDAWVSTSRPIAGRRDARVLVVGGTESLGILAAQMAVAAGAAEVDYYDDSGYRNTLAEKGGATIYEGGKEGLYERYDIVVSATREHDKFHTALMALAPGGHCSCIGIMFDEPTIPLFPMYLKDVTLSVGVCSVRPHIPAVLDLVNQGKCDPMLVTPQVIPWEDAPRVLVDPLAKAVVVRPRLFASTGQRSAGQPV